MPDNMQTAHKLPPLNIDLAQRKQLSNHASSVAEALKLAPNPDILGAPHPGEVGPNPPSPLSPPTFLAKDSTALPPFSKSPSEPLLLNNRYLLLEFIDGAVSPQSQPLRRCVDTVTEEVYFCRVCSKTPSTNSVLEAHHRLRESGTVTPISQVIQTIQGSDCRAIEENFYLLSPASYGDLHSYLRAKRRLKENEAKNLFRQAAEAVYDCHRNGVVLTDLKLRRFVFADAQRTKLRLESLEEAVVLDRYDSDDSVWRKHGYPAYVTPEVLLSRGARYSGRAADLWSLGIILYTLLVGRYPFQDSGPFGLFTKIIRGHFVVPDFVSSRARCLIRNLLRREPNQRLEAGDILRHPWFTPVLRPGKVDQFKDKPEFTAGVPGTVTTELVSSGVTDQLVPRIVSRYSQMED